jgi:hypothetical protein
MRITPSQAITFDCDLRLFVCSAAPQCSCSRSDQSVSSPCAKAEHTTSFINSIPGLPSYDRQTTALAFTFHRVPSPPADLSSSRSARGGPVPLYTAKPVAEIDTSRTIGGRKRYRMLQDPMTLAIAELGCAERTYPGRKDILSSIAERDPELIASPF